ncbi:MAG: hypothetical protein KGV50_01155 [Gammaproteobacteria bacterium]|nr:hypothetical protein [Gammaproteobacteria bacterium]
MANKANYLDLAVSSMQPAIDVNDSLGNNATHNVGVALRENKCRGFINLRLKADNENGKKAVKKVLGIALPSINQRASSDVISIIGFSPNEWLIITESGAEMDIQAKLESALADMFSLVCDVTGGMTILNITGVHAQDLLEKGTYVDLHESVFPPDSLYATQIAHAPAVIVKNASNDFSLVVRRSFSNHIAHWAVDGAAEYGYTFS